MDDELRQEVGSAQPPGGRFSRRAFAGGLAAIAGCATLLAAGHTVVGRGNDAPRAVLGSPQAQHRVSPGASPAASPSASPTAGNQITISNFSFMPAKLSVPAGTEVTWINQDDIPHTVTSNDGKTFASQLLDTGDTFRFRFAEPGTYAYHCALHPFMTAQVIVHAQGATS